jgi:hypothetical protein
MLATSLFAICLAIALAGFLYQTLRARKLRKLNIQFEKDSRELAEKHAEAAKLWDEQSTELKERYAQSFKQWNEYAERVKSELQRLSQYAGIPDAEAKARELIANGQATLQESIEEAASIAANARAEAAQLREEARGVLDAAASTAQQIQDSARLIASEIELAAREAAKSIDAEAVKQAKRLKDDAQAAASLAEARALSIVAEAKKRAEEIAGSAYEAMQNAASYERAVQAMKNIIEGYGDQYLMPAQSLLDDLADEFGHTEAAQELKKARNRTKTMMFSGAAATCDYVEANRRETAINFVMDAFNGKVDSVLSRVKEDNVGTLAQEIRDAFALVNYNGKAFRSARITDAYLSARLDELKWAATVQQLKAQEREEQRRIKEQIREEEKARREYERAIRDAAKEEDLLRKAMEKAYAQLEYASAQERGKYEQQLQELSERLKQAEERNQRALSMAQQTRRGHVYIISNVGSFGEDVYKIGLTRRLEPLDRIRELGDSSVPFDFDVHALIFSEDAPALETSLHKHFVLLQMNKVNYRKEFFRVPLTHIREEVEKMSLEAKWTMTSEARQYHETLAIEKAIKEDPAKKEAWLKRQLELEVAENAFCEDAAVEA